jgi:hypothetical protein
MALDLLRNIHNSCVSGEGSALVRRQARIENEDVSDVRRQDSEFRRATVPRKKRWSETV